MNGVTDRLEVHHRRSIRLPTYDYSRAGAYFVTICTYGRELLFDDALLKAVAQQVWQTVAATNADGLDEFVVMPNHVHGILWIAPRRDVGAQQQPRTFGAEALRGPHTNLVGKQ